MKAYALVVQLDHLLLERCSEAAEAEGFDVVPARSGDEALSKIQELGMPGLVLTALSLPRLDGFGLIARLRAGEGAIVPVIAVSAFRALRDAAQERREELMIADVLPAGASTESIRASIRRAAAGGWAAAPAGENQDVEAASRRRETSRLRRIDMMGVDQGLPHDPMFQALAEEAAHAMEAPIGLITIALNDRVWFKAHTGFDRILLEEPGTAREWPFCRHVVGSGAELVVPDARDHPVFGRNPLVRDGHVRGYAGAPVIAPGGEVVGTICVASPETLHCGPEAIDALTALARKVAGEQELRAAARRAPEEADRFGCALGADHGPATLMATLLMARTALESLDTGVIVTDAHRRIAYANAGACVMLGLPESRLTGMSREEVVSHCCGVAADPAEFLRKVRVPPSGPYVARAEFEFTEPERRCLRWVSRPIQLPSGLGQLTLLTDVTAENDLAAEKERFAVTDGLTGLLNRRGGVEAVSREVARARRTGVPLSFVLFDVDGLKRVNLDRGYDAGDHVLREAARALREAARECDLVARWGGEEFLAVLSGCTSDEAGAMAERAVAGLNSPELDDLPGVGISAGVVQLRDGESGEQAIARAEVQLLSAKESGGGT